MSSILPEYSFEQVIDFASENGFACVELACWPFGKAERRYAGVTHIDMDSLDDDKVNYINDYCTKRNVSISGIGYYPNPLSDDLEQRKVAVEHIKKCIKGAAKLGHGLDYKYAHDYPDHYVKQQYLPDEILGTTFYEPTEMGYEKKIKDWLNRLKKD